MPTEQPRSHGFSRADLCLRWKVGPDKISGFIRRGDLVAVNVATHVSARPQWRITPEAVAQFELRRTSAPTPKTVPRRRRPEIVDYYADDMTDATKGGTRG